MNDKKLRQLFGAAKKDMPAPPTEGFERLVMQHIRRNPARAELSVSDLLGHWFPRLALAAAVIIAVCVVGEYASTGPSLSESAAQLSIQELAEN